MTNAEHGGTIAVGDSTRAWLLPVLPPGYAPAVEWSSSDPEIEDLRAQSEAFSEVSAVQWRNPIMYGDVEPSRVFGWSVSTCFFESSVF